MNESNANCIFFENFFSNLFLCSLFVSQDFSCSDRKFAHNVGMNFATPEAFFDGEAEADFSWQSIDPSGLPTSGTPCSGNITSSKQEMILFVGYPGAGKTTFAKTYLVPAGYEWVNRDTLKTAAKCKAAVRAALAAGKSVVVDNTSPTASARAGERNSKVIIFLIDSSICCYQLSIEFNEI